MSFTDVGSLFSPEFLPVDMSGGAAAAAAAVRYVDSAAFGTEQELQAEDLYLDMLLATEDPHFHEMETFPPVGSDGFADDLAFSDCDGSGLYPLPQEAFSADGLRATSPPQCSPKPQMAVLSSHLSGEGHELGYGAQAGNGDEADADNGDGEHGYEAAAGNGDDVHAVGPFAAFAKLKLPQPPQVPAADLVLKPRKGSKNSVVTALDWPASYFEVPRGQWGALKTALSAVGFSKKHIADLNKGRRRHKSRTYSTHSRAARKVDQCLDGSPDTAKLQRSITSMRKREDALRRDKEILKDLVRRINPGAFESILGQLSTY